MPPSDIDQSLSMRPWPERRPKCRRFLRKELTPCAKAHARFEGRLKNGHAECVRLILSVSDPKADESYALRAAAHYGHVECVRRLPVSGPLGEIDGLLEKVLESGHANVAALLIEQEPRLLDGVDLSKGHAAALERGHGDVASYLSSLMDQRELGASRRMRRGAGREPQGFKIGMRHGIFGLAC